MKSTNRINIAIVDDAPFIREIFKSIARNQGWYVCLELESGENADVQILNEKPQIVIMDLVLPITNGIDVTKSILKKNKNIKIIACSTIDKEDVLAKAIEAGCCSYITKPFNKVQVIKAVEEAIKMLEAV